MDGYIKREILYQKIHPLRDATYMDGYIKREILYQKIHPLRDATFGADCLTPLRILKIIPVGLKNGFW